MKDEFIISEILDFVLYRTDVERFNMSIRNFSVQILYRIPAIKRDLMQKYPNLMPSSLHYSIVMSEVFEAYKCDEIECPRMLRRIDSIKRLLPTYKRMNQQRWAEKVVEHDLLVKEYLVLLEPQNLLIKRYKSIRKELKKAIS